MTRAMKNSGIEWIGEIPKDWEVCRLKNYAIICNGQDSKNVYDIDGRYPVMGSGGEFSCARQYMFDKPSVLLGRKGTIDKPVFVDFPFWTVDTMYYTKPTSICKMKYFYYLCTTIDFQYYQYGSAVPSMTQRDLNSIKFPLLKDAEQTQIATYLDRKCTKIDETIEMEKQVIEKLKAYKQSMITEAVTKGLDPETPKKDSGIEWIGKIPEHWSVCKLMYITRMKSGNNITSENIEPVGDYPVYGGNGLRGYTNSFTNSGKYILIGRQGALCGNVRLVDQEFWASEHAIVLYPLHELNEQWLLKNLYSMNLNQYSTSAAQPGLAVEQIQKIYTCVPPLQEQNEIAFYLDNKCTKIDKSITLKDNLIEKLTQYKKSLIYECVTGKRDV